MKKPASPTCSHFLLSGLASLGLSTTAWSQSPVPITNQGFEDPTTADGLTSSPIPGWSVVAGTPTIFNPTTTQFGSEAPEGENIASVFGGADGDGISQSLAGATGQLQEGAVYALTLEVGDPSDATFDGYKVQLLANGTVLAEDDNTVVPVDGEFATVTVNYTYDVADAALLGEPLEIRLLSKGAAGGETTFEDVQLTVTLTNPIAEPGGPYTVPVGGSLNLDGSGSLAPDGQSITLYEWDLNNDGSYDVTGVTPTAITEADLVNIYGMVIGADNDIVLRVTDDSTPTPKVATALGTVSLAAPIAGQLGVLDLDANGGINPNTGVAWAVGDQYRIGFLTSGTRTADTADIQDYNDFAQGLANNSVAFPKLGYGLWKVMGSTDAVSARVNTGTNDTTAGVGVPMFLMDGQTLIASDNEDLWNGFPLRFPAGSSPNGQAMYFSFYLDEEGIEDASGTFGPNVATGSLESGNSEGPTRTLGNTAEVPARITHGNSRANTGGRIIRRFNGAASSNWKFYALSDPLTVVDLTDTAVPGIDSIVDDVSGGPVTFPAGVVYTVTFDEAMSAGTINVDDFENSGSGTASITIDSVSPTADPAVFEVSVTPTTAGTIQLQIKVGAELRDLVGNLLDTTSAIADDTTITVDADSVDPIADTLSPANGAIDQALSPSLVITFIEASAMAIGTGNIEILDASDDSVLQTIDVTGPSVSLTGPLEATIATSSIPFGTSVYVNIDSGAFVDLSGNAYAGISDDSTWAFSVIGLPVPDGPLSVFTATNAGETIPFGPSELVHGFDTFSRLSADHLPATPSDIQMSAGHHLVIYNSRIDSSSGSANRTEVQSKLSLAGADLAAGWSQGYIRRQEGQDETITAGGAIINVASAGDLLQLRTFRTDNTASEAAIREPGNTGIQLLKLDDAWDYLSLVGHDGSGTDQVLPASNMTWSPVTYAQELEKDTGSFEYLSGSGVTLKTAGHYLVCANSYNSGANERTGIVQRLTLGGVQIDGSVTTVYLRGPSGNSSQEGSTTIGMIIETTAADQLLNVELRQSDNDGTVDVIGERTSLTIVKLPDTADYIRLSDLTGGQNVNATGAVNYDDDPASQLELDASFTHSPTADPSQIGVTATGDYLFLGSFFVASDGVSRGFPNLGWQINGTGGIAANGQTGRYSRNSGPPELGNWSGFMTGLTASDYVETLTAPLGNPGGSNPATALAMQGVSIESLFSTTPPANPYDTWAAGPFLGTLTDPSPDVDFDGGGLDTGIEWVVGGDPTDPSDDAGLAPTIDTTTNAGFLTFVYNEADVAAADPNTSIVVEYGSDLTGWTEASADGVNIIINETENGAVDSVEVQLLRSAFEVDGKLFARLKVTVTAP